MGCDDAYGRAQSQRARLPARPEPADLEAVVHAGGYWFDVAAKKTEEEAEGEEEEEESGESGEEEEEENMALFLPSGWWHWLVGDAPWHVAWSGSIFPASSSSSRAADGDRSGRGRGRGRGKKR